MSFPDLTYIQVFLAYLNKIIFIFRGKHAYEHHKNNKNSELKQNLTVYQSRFYEM